MNTHWLALAPYLFVHHNLKWSSSRIETYIHEFAGLLPQYKHCYRMIDNPSSILMRYVVPVS